MLHMAYKILATTDGMSSAYLILCQIINYPTHKLGTISHILGILYY